VITGFCCDETWPVEKVQLQLVMVPAAKLESKNETIVPAGDGGPTTTVKAAEQSDCACVIAGNARAAVKVIR
jgi:hypothetical protein